MHRLKGDAPTNVDHPTITEIDHIDEGDADTNATSGAGVGDGSGGGGGGGLTPRGSSLGFETPSSDR